MIPFQAVCRASCVYVKKPLTLHANYNQYVKKKISCNGYFADVRTAVGNGCLKQWKQNCKKKKSRKINLKALRPRRKKQKNEVFSSYTDRFLIKDRPKECSRLSYDV